MKIDRQTASDAHDVPTGGRKESEKRGGRGGGSSEGSRGHVGDVTDRPNEGKAERRRVMSKFALIAAVIAALGVPFSASAGHLRHSHPCVSLSEMVSCGKQGVKGNRAQFVAATTRPVEDSYFLRQLAH